MGRVNLPVQATGVAQVVTAVSTTPERSVVGLAVDAGKLAWHTWQLADRRRSIHGGGGGVDGGRGSKR